MSDVQSEIARIAALRGRDASNYLRPLAHVQTIHPQRIALLFSGDGNQRGDLLMFDALPAKSRALLRDSPIWISAWQYAESLAVLGDEAQLIRLIEVEIAARLKQPTKSAHSPRY